MLFWWGIILGGMGGGLRFGIILCNVGVLFCYVGEGIKVSGINLIFKVIELVNVGTRIRS